MSAACKLYSIYSTLYIRVTTRCGNNPFEIIQYCLSTWLSKFILFVSVYEMPLLLFSRSYGRLTAWNIGGIQDRAVVHRKKSRYQDNVRTSITVGEGHPQRNLIGNCLAWTRKRTSNNCWIQMSDVWLPHRNGSSLLEDGKLAQQKNVVRWHLFCSTVLLNPVDLLIPLLNHSELTDAILFSLSDWFYNLCSFCSGDSFQLWESRAAECPRYRQELPWYIWERYRNDIETVD